MANPDRGNNISKALSGVAKSPEHTAKIKAFSIARWEKQEERDKQSERLITRLIKKNYRNKKTKLETNFEAILEGLNIKYKYQHQVSSAIFDFLLLDQNILVEVDGDFHHCNPNTIHRIPTYPIQLKSVGNDLRKNIIASDNSYKLLRFWETDINKHPEQVITRLKQELGL
jgi:very-short-patch-repair endonuclease